MPQFLRYVFVCIVLIIGFAFAYPFRKIPAAPKGELQESHAEVLVLRADVELEPQREFSNPVRGAVKMLDIVTSEDVISKTISRPSSKTIDQAASTGSNQLDTATRALPSIKENAQRLPSIVDYLNQKKAVRTQHAATKNKRQAKPVERFTLHRIVDGDDLKNLAANYLDSPNRHLEIFELNRDVIKHPDVLPLHTEIKIPMN